MNDIAQLEAKVRREIKAASAEDLDTLAQHHWAAASTTADYRQRQKSLKRSSHYAGLAFERGIGDAQTLRLYMDIIRQTASVHNFPQDERRKLSRITARWLEETGAGDHKVLSRLKSKVPTDTATFGLGDVGLAPDPTDEPSYEGQMVGWMARGQRLFFGTGYDGAIKAELRLIDGVEPVLSPSEYKKLESSTPTLVLAAPTGRIALADYGFMTEPWRDDPPGEGLVIEVSPGAYKVCVFGFSSSRWDSVVAVLCPTDEASRNDVASVDSLFI